MTLLEQFQAIKTVEDLKNYLCTNKGEIRYEVAPAVRAEDGPAILELLKSSPSGPSTAPVVSVPVVTPVVAGLLPASMTGGFKLKGTEKQQHPVDLLKGRVYEVKVVVASVDGGGVYAQFRNPDGSGFGSKDKLKQGENTFSVTSPVTGSRLFSVEANNANVTVSAVSLTLKDA